LLKARRSFFQTCVILSLYFGDGNFPESATRTGRSIDIRIDTFWDKTEKMTRLCLGERFDMLLLLSTIIKSGASRSRITKNNTTSTSQEHLHAVSNKRTRSDRKAPAAATGAVPRVFRTSDSTFVTAEIYDDDNNDSSSLQDDATAAICGRWCSFSTDEKESTSSATPSCRRRLRTVGFTTVTVQEHCLVLGDHPSCSGSFPLTLDWKHATPIKYTLEEYQAYQKQTRSSSRISSQLKAGPRRQLLVEGVAGPAAALRKQKSKTQQQSQDCHDDPSSAPRRLSAMERRQRLLTVTDTTLAMLQQDEFQRRVKLFGLLETKTSDAPHNNAPSALSISE
jgi:hypothetical protein